jgi:trimethylamine--corrinoid protein Co-methyltransferase
MKVNYRANGSMQFSTLSTSEIEDILSTSLEILEGIGMMLMSDEVVDMLKKAGAWVDSKGRTHIPAFLVKRALTTAASRIVLSGRDGSRKVVLEKDRIYYGTGSDTPFMYDPYTGERRGWRFEDVYNSARTADYLPNIDFFMSHGLVQDVPPKTYDRAQFLAMITGISKPMIVTAVDGAGLKDQHEMACAVLGGEGAFRAAPVFGVYIEPISPLQHSPEVMDKLLYAADKGIPIVYVPAPSAGGTAPVTMAGILAQGVAESLAGLVISQLRSPGAGLIMGGVYTVLDFRTMIFSYGSPELQLLSAALTDIAKYLGIPMFSTAGCSDACTFDEQATFEAGFQILLTALTGANLIHDVGYIESGLNGSLEMLVFCDEAISMVKRLVSGVRVTPETLALDVIRDVGPGGHYLQHEHTLAHFKEEVWRPTLLNRLEYNKWQEYGGKTLKERVHNKVLRILEEHKPAPIAPEALKKMKDIVARAEGRA